MVVATYFVYRFDLTLDKEQRGTFPKMSNYSFMNLAGILEQDS